MARPRLIVGIGAALELDAPDRATPGGLALATALAASRMGQRGVPISRVGQDPTGDALLGELRAAELDVSHIQSDPDLPTARLVVRSIAGQQTRRLDANAAFDNLQWDFDLEDVGQRTEVAVYGMLARRSGQARSTIDRFLAVAQGALRVFDLTSESGEAFDRSAVGLGLEYAQVAVVDEAALAALQPVENEDRLVEFTRAHDLLVAVQADRERPLRLVAGAESADASTPCAPAGRTAGIVALSIALANGTEIASARDAMMTAAAHAAAHPDAPFPDGPG